MKAFTLKEKEILEKARAIMEEKALYKTNCLTSPALTSDYLKLHFATQEREVFTLLCLNSQHEVITCENVFFGTIDSASVYPREVVKLALQHNAAAVILSHNHPSGIPEPSQADKTITNRLVEALKLIDVRVLDHLVIGGNDSVSFAERGLI